MDCEYSNPLSDFSDINPINFNNEKDLMKELDEFTNLTKDISADWKKREAAIKRLGGIIIGNFGLSQNFIKLFNNKLCINLSVQMVDLRSSLMKEACRISILASEKLHESMEPSAEKFFSSLVLFKMVNSANKLISDAGANCILGILNNVESSKLIARICEQVKNKNNTVRLRVTEQLLFILSKYSENTINKNIPILEVAIRAMTHDASLEVRTVAKKLFFKYLELNESGAVKLLKGFDSNVQKAINEAFNRKECNSNEFESETNFKSNIDYKSSKINKNPSLNSSPERDREKPLIRPSTAYNFKTSSTKSTNSSNFSKDTFTGNKSIINSGTTTNGHYISNFSTVTSVNKFPPKKTTNIDDDKETKFDYMNSKKLTVIESKINISNNNYLEDEKVEEKIITIVNSIINETNENNKLLHFEKVSFIFNDIYSNI